MILIKEFLWLILLAGMVTHTSTVLEHISVLFLVANASFYWDNEFQVKPFEKIPYIFKVSVC